MPIAKGNWNGFRSKLNSVSQSGLHREMMSGAYDQSRVGTETLSLLFFAPVAVIIERTVMTFFE